MPGHGIETGCKKHATCTDSTRNFVISRCTLPCLARGSTRQVVRQPPGNQATRHPGIQAFHMSLLGKPAHRRRMMSSVVNKFNGIGACMPSFISRLRHEPNSMSTASPLVNASLITRRIQILAVAGNEMRWPRPENSICING